MKNRILTFVIGILTGAIIMTLIFSLVNQPINPGHNENIQQNGNGQTMPPNWNMNQPPEKPNGSMEHPQEFPNENI